MRTRRGLLSERRRSRVTQLLIGGGGASILLIGAAVLYFGASSQDASLISDVHAESGMSWVPPAESLDAQIAESDIVVLGRFTAIAGETNIDPEIWDEDNYSDGVSPGVAFTNFIVEVDEYLYGEGPSVITVRKTGNRSHPIEFPAPPFGEHVLLFLSAWPNAENVWGTFRGPWGYMLESGGTITYIWAGHDVPVEVPFLAGISLEQALTDVRAAVRATSSP